MMPRETELSVTCTPRERTERLARVEALAGKFTGVFGPNCLRDLREEWPE